MFYLRYLGLIFVVTLLDVTVAQRIAIAGVRPDLSLALVVYAGLAGGGRGGVLVGLCVGILRGCGQPELLGLDMLLLSVVGFAAAYTSPMVNRDHPIVQAGLIALLLLGHDLVRALVVTSFSIPGTLSLWFTVSFGAAAYTAVLAPCAVALLPRMLLEDPRRAVS